MSSLLLISIIVSFLYVRIIYNQIQIGQEQKQKKFFSFTVANIWENTVSFSPLEVQISCNEMWNNFVASIQLVRFIVHYTGPYMTVEIDYWEHENKRNNTQAQDCQPTNQPSCHVISHFHFHSLHLFKLISGCPFDRYIFLSFVLANRYLRNELVHVRHQTSHISCGWMWVVLV